MNQEVTAFIDSLQVQWQGAICGTLRGIVHTAIPDVTERMQYKKPHFLKNGKYAAVISTSKDAVSFTIFNATGLALPDGFDGPPERKTLKLREGQAADEALLTALVGQAAAGL